MVDLHLDTLICMMWVLLLPASLEDVKMVCDPGSNMETPSKGPHKYRTSRSIKFSLRTMIPSQPQKGENSCLNTYEEGFFLETVV